MTARRQLVREQDLAYAESLRADGEKSIRAEAEKHREMVNLIDLLKRIGDLSPKPSNVPSPPPAPTCLSVCVSVYAKRVAVAIIG